MPLSSGQEGTTTDRHLNKLQYAITNVAAANATVAGGDVIPVLDASDSYAVKYSTVDQVLLNDGSGVFTNIDAGASGTAGTVDIFPSTAAKGKIALTAADSAGDTTTTIVNASQAAARTYTIPDAGASASFVMTEGAQTINGTKTIPAIVTTNLDAGASGTAGTIDIFPTTASKGKLAMSVTDQTGDTTVSLTIGAMAAARTITLRDPGAAASFLTTTDGTAAATSATAAEVTAYCAAASRIVSITDATPYTVLAANSGKIHIIPELTSNTTFNLPTAAAGLEYTFISKGIAAEAQNWIFTAGGTAYLLGGVAFADNDAGAGADEIHAGLYPNGSSHLTLTVVTPAAGCKLYFVCDGTNWIVTGWINSATVPAFS